MVNNIGVINNIGISGSEYRGQVLQCSNSGVTIGVRSCINGVTIGVRSCINIDPDTPPAFRIRPEAVQLADCAPERSLSASAAMAKDRSRAA